MFGTPIMKDNQDMIMENMATYSSTMEKTPWKILIVDDEIEVHRMTRLVLSDVEFNGRPLIFLSALSAFEARDLIERNPDIAVVLLDVVMETDNAGLELVSYVRNVLKNDRIRMIIRSGQTGSVSEQDIVARYGIDDYKSKLELTNEKLNVSIISSLRAFQKADAMFWRLAELEDQLKLQKQKHEILRPVNAILKTAGKLLDSDPKPEQREYLQGIQENCRTLQRIVDPESLGNTHMKQVKQENNPPSGSGKPGKKDPCFGI